jgi:hypothetical protein
MRYWWVNQNQAYRAELRGSFMWSPNQNANVARNKFYDNMRNVSPGDIVLSFCDTRIKAIGVVTGRAQAGSRYSLVLWRLVEEVVGATGFERMTPARKTVRDLLGAMPKMTARDGCRHAETRGKLQNSPRSTGLEPATPA